MSLLTRQVLLGSFLLGCGFAGCGPSTRTRTLPGPRDKPHPAGSLPRARDDGRLPKNVRPSRYHLELTVDPTQPTFFGRARIGVEIEEPSNVVVLHAKGPKILTAAISTSSAKHWAKSFSRRAAGAKDEAEELVLTVDGLLPRGSAEIDLQYEAPFGKNLSGLYRVEEGGKFYAFTQFEPNDARRAFPCFDEPGFKTPVKLVVTVPDGNLVVGNMPEQSRRTNEATGLSTFDFTPSPPLPTYLVALAVGPLELREGARDPVPIRLVTLPGKSALGSLALEAARDELDLLARYFGVPYPYPKLDLVAVPEFGAGAMENVGLVTFREELLLLDEARASTDARRHMVGVMAHELAHQWFGNLVTPQWWDDLWLNEAFATWMGGKIVSEYRPRYAVPLERVSDKQWVMGIDSLASARKIRQPVRSTSEALESFDGITYVKGGAVLGMVERWLGEQSFREGIRRYLEEHRFGNATSEDLFGALGKAGGDKPVSPVMASFVDRTGVPLVSVTSSCKALTPGKAEVRLELSQKVYRPVGATRPGSVAPWILPVCVRVGSDAPRCELLDRESRQVTVTTKSCPDFVHPNADEVGYYRYTIGPEAVRLLATAPEKRLSTRERIGLVGDAWALVRSGDLAPADYLGLIDGFAAEDSHVVWDQILDSMSQIERVLSSDAARDELARRVAGLFGPVARRVGWEPKAGETEEAHLLRKIALSGLGLHGRDPATRDRALELVERWLTDPKSVPADVAEVAVAIAARSGDEKLFEKLLAFTKQAKLPQERVLALGGLSGFDDPKLVERALDLSLDGSLKVSDSRYLFPPLFERPVTARPTYDWLRRHFDALAGKLPSFVVGRFPWVAAGLCDEAGVSEVEAFFRPRLRKIEGADKQLDQAIEAGKLCAAFRAAQGGALEKAL